MEGGRRRGEVAEPWSVLMRADSKALSNSRCQLTRETRNLGEKGKFKKFWEKNLAESTCRCNRKGSSEIQDIDKNSEGASGGRLLKESSEPNRLKARERQPLGDSKSGLVKRRGKEKKGKRAF